MASLLERPTIRERQAPRRDTDTTVLRARLLGALLALAFLGLVARLWFLQIAHGDDYQHLAQANHTRLIRDGAPRGLIEDRNGVVIASNRSQFAIFAQPAVATDALTLKRLSALLGMTPTGIVQAIHDGKKNDYDPIRIALDVPIGLVTRIEEERSYLPGISAAPVPVRWYPGDSLLGNALGSLGRINPASYDTYKEKGYFPDDFIGLNGLEAQYEPYLHGAPGGRELEIDARGREVRQTGYQQATPGDTVVLSVDARVQAAAEATFRAHNFVGGAVAVNPQTGAVIAMASSPSVNANLFATGIKQNAWNSLLTDPHKPLLDRAVDTLYPPGSTFKQVVAAAGLQNGTLTTHSTAYCTGVYHLGRAKFHCWQVHGGVDFFRAMAVSCDVFFYQAGLKMGPERLSYYARQYPLAQLTGIDLPHEMIGSIPSPAWKERHFHKLSQDYRTWYGGDTLNMSIGQGYVLVTPLQLALTTATTANGGSVLQPYLVQRVLDSQKHVVLENHRTVLRHVGISPQNMEDVRLAMRQTVTSGTGKIVDFKDIAVAAKTGSAQVHGQAKTHGLFVAFAPYDHPTIAVAAVVERGGHGASSAGYIVRAMLQAYFHKKVDYGVVAGPSD